MKPEPEDNPSTDAERASVAVPDHDLLRVIGRGSYGEVWEARNVMGTPRAVKIVRRCDFDSARPFEREFEGIQRYEPVSRTHAGLVQVLHVGRDAAGTSFYYVMELADAAEGRGGDYVPKTLRSELHRRRVLPVAECIDVGISLASALGHLHRAGLVHRDVKPSNIIFVDGVAKLADVGLVARLSDSRSMVGTEGYYAPEGTGQPRSDVYSLGKVLYECVTGQDRLSFPDVPPEWGGGSDSRAAFEFMEIVLRAAESDPHRRYRDTDEMLADLALLKAGKSLRYLRRVETRLKRTLQVLAFAALGIAAAGGAWLYEKSRADRIAAAEQSARAAQAAAQVAQAETRDLLGKSLVAEARAVRLSGLAGARARALDAVRRGLEAGAPVRDLRTQAASALGLIDAGDPLPGAGLQLPGAVVMWSPDGAHAVVCDGADGDVSVVDRQTGQAVAAFAAGRPVTEVSVSPRAQHVALLHRDGSVTLWETQDGRKVWEQAPARHAPRPWFSRDGTWIVMGTDDGIVARSCGGGDPVIIVPGAAPLRGLQLSPDGRWIASLPVPVPSDKPGEHDQGLGLEIFTGLPGSMPGPGAAAKVKRNEIESDIQLEGMSISADSRYVAAGLSEDRIKVWEVPSMTQMVWLRGHQRSVRATAFHPTDSNIVLSTSWDGTTRLWDISTRQQTLVVPVGGEEILFSAARGELLLRTWERSGFKAAGVSRRSALRAYDIPPITRLGLLNNVVWSRDGSLLACAGAVGVVLWDVATGAAVSAQSSEDPMQWRHCAFHPRDGSIHFSGRDGLFRRTVKRGAGGAIQLGPRERVLEGFASFLEWQGDSLAVSGRFNDAGRGGIALVRPDGGQGFLEATRSPDQFGVSPDGRWVAMATYPGGGGTIWDLSLELPAARDVETPGRAHFGFSADGRTLVTGLERVITFTDPADGRTVAPPVPRHDVQEIPSHLASSESAGLLAVSTGPTEVTLCDGRSFEPLFTLDSPLTPFDCAMSFSPDGRFLALAGGTSRLMVWDLAWIREELTAMGLGW